MEKETEKESPTEEVYSKGNLFYSLGEKETTFAKEPGLHIWITPEEKREGKFPSFLQFIEEYLKAIRYPLATRGHDVGYELRIPDLESRGIKTEEKLDALKSELEEKDLENERLKSRVSELQRSNNREIQRYDQESAKNSRLIDHVIERMKANDILQAALIAREGGRMSMFESYEGVVKHVETESIVVLFEIDDELVEHTYKKDQFIGGRLPSIGERLAVYVHVATLPQEKEDKSTLGEPENGKKRKPRKFKSGPIEI